MGFYPQPNGWQCGPFALKHALAMIGQFVDERSITRATKTTRTGTNEIMLRRAASRFDCTLREIRKLNSDDAYTALVRALEKNLPCLLCINQWGHWVTIVTADTRHKRFVMLDSARDPVVTIVSWRELSRRWAYLDNTQGDARNYFDLYVLRPTGRRQTSADFSLKRAQYLQRRSAAGLLKHFDEYVSDMLHIARPAEQTRRSNVSMAEFLRRHRTLVLNAVRYWNPNATEASLKHVLANMQFVAEAYGLVICADEEREAVVNFTAMLVHWADTHHPVSDALYGEEG